MNLADQRMVKELEKKLGELIPLDYFLVTAFSRNALFLLLKALGWKKPDEIIIPAFTCPVIRHTVAAANVVPVPVDAEENGLNMEPELIKKAINDNTRAIYVVHTYGTPAQIEKICTLAWENHLVVIEDLAHSLFTRYRGKQLGTFGDFTILSFTKQIINFEGGAVATNDTEIYRKMLLLRKIYQEQGRFRPGSLVDSYVRIVGSWWESGFSLPALFSMKVNDWLNKVIYKGRYGIRIDFTKFYASNLGSCLPLLQLEKLYRKKTRMASYQSKGEQSYVLDEGSFQTYSPYQIQLVSKEEVLSRFLSFRTWQHSFNTGDYPRSECLYQQLRIFSGRRTDFRKPSKVVSEIQ